MTGERKIVDNINEIPEGVLCTFAKKITRGVQYFVGYRKGDVIHVHFSMTKHSVSDIISYQHVLSSANRVIKM